MSDKEDSSLWIQRGSPFQVYQVLSHVYPKSKTWTLLGFDFWLYTDKSMLVWAAYRWKLKTWHKPFVVSLVPLCSYWSEPQMIVVTTLFVFFPTTWFLLLKTTYALSKLDASVASGFWQAENLSKLGAGLIGPRSHSQSSLSLSLSLSLISNRPHSYGVPCSSVRVQFNIPTSNGCLISAQ
jgi:hypothetical protein